MRVLITGAAGFIGFHTVNRFLNEDHTVIGLDNINDYYSVELKNARLNEAGISANNELPWGELIESTKDIQYKFIRMNLEDKIGLQRLFEKQNFDIVIHLAAQAGVRYSIENPDAYIQSNIVGFHNVLECCRYSKIKHLVYASSSSVYGLNKQMPFSVEQKADTPVSLYAATKRSNELMAHSYSHLYGMQTTGLRFFTVYGPWGRPDMANMLFADAIVKNEPIKVFNHGKMKRDFTYIDDIVDGVYKISVVQPKTDKDLEKIESYNIFNIGNSQPVELLKFIKLIEKKLGLKAKLEMKDMQPGDVYETWADITALREVCGYTPKTTIEEGLKVFTEWYTGFYSIDKSKKLKF